MGHAFVDFYSSKQEKRNMLNTDNQYDTMGEKWVIENVETPAARILGEGVRTNHDGISFKSKNSTSIENIE